MARPATTRPRMKGLTILRIRGNLTQQMLAKLSGIPQPVISNYERGLSIPPEHAGILWRAITSVVQPEEIKLSDLDTFYPEPDCEN